MGEAQLNKGLEKCGEPAKSMVYDQLEIEWQYVFITLNNCPQNARFYVIFNLECFQ